MKNELDQFENRSDDWLARQRNEEDQVSAWDFDEGKRLKAEHEARHEAYNRINNIHSSMEMMNRIENGEMPMKRKLQRQQMQKNKRVVSMVITIFAIFYIFCIMMVILFS